MCAWNLVEKVADMQTSTLVKVNVFHLSTRIITAIYFHLENETLFLPINFQKSTFKMFDNNLTLGKKTNNPPTTEKWTCSFPEKRPIFMIDWLKSVAHWRQNPQMRSNDWFLLFCGWSHYTITKRSYERRSRKGGNELATISQCMKKRPNFIGYLIKLQKWRLFWRTARNAPRFYYTE